MTPPLRNANSQLSKESKQGQRYVCGGHCRQPQAPSFEFMQDLHAYCTDSKNFERYLVKHYFLNTGQGWSPKEPTGSRLFEESSLANHRSYFFRDSGEIPIFGLSFQ